MRNYLQATRHRAVAMKCLLCLLAIGVLLVPDAARSQEVDASSGDTGLYAGSNSRAGSWSDFDIRRFRSRSGTKTSGGEGRALELRQSGEAAISAFRAELGAERNQVRGRINGFGLPRVLSGVGRALSGPSSADAADAARTFLSEHRAMFPFSGSELSEMKLVSRTEEKGITFVHFQQRVGGIGVHDGYVGIVVGAKGNVLQVSSREAVPGLQADLKAKTSLPEAVRSMLMASGAKAASPRPLARRVGASLLFKNPFGRDLLPIAARPEIFVMSATEGRLAYRMVVHRGPSEAYEVVLDANDGTVLQRRSLVDYGQGRVFKQTPVKADRELVDFPEGEDGWIDEGAETTSGNNSDVYVDRRGLGGPNSSPGEPNLDDGRPIGPGGVFDFPVGEGATTGEDPREFGAAAATNLFYFINLSHDYFYGLGFDEAAGNFQIRNFERGGEGDDAVIGRSQHRGLTNNASMFTPEDGMNAIMRMGVFTQGTATLADDRDSSFSDQVAIHEYTHGVTNRRVGGPQQVRCLDGIQSGGMGEGWSDYFSITITDDPLVGGYLIPGGGAAGGEGGIRRASYEGYPFTYANIGNEGYQVHRDGEIWAATLWDARTALGAEVMDQLVYSGLGFTPCLPSMVDARDGIIMADAELNGGANAGALWEVFAAHGLGASAAGDDGGFVGGELRPSIHTAAFDVPAEFSEANRPPAVTSSPAEIAATRGDLWSYQIEATDPEGDAISYEVVEGPEGATVDENGLVTWTPVFMDERVVVNVTDANGASSAHGFQLLLSDSEVSIGDSFQIDGRPGSVGLASFEVPVGTAILQLTLRDGVGDSDLGVFVPPLFDFYSSARNDTAETMTFANPRPGLWFVTVRAFRPFDDVQLAIADVQPTPIAPATTLNGLTGARTSETFYSIDVPPATGRLLIASSGGSGDMHLTTSYVRPPVCQFSEFAVSSPCQFELESRTEMSNDEMIDIQDPAPGTWLVNLFGSSEYSDVSLAVTTEIEDPARPRVSRNAETGAVAILNAASFQPSVSPGALASLFGQTRNDGTFAADSIPLPRELGGIKVYVDDIESPILFGNNGQVNFQIPFESFAGQSELRLENAGVLSAPQAVRMLEDAPGLFGLDGTTVDPDPEMPGDIIVARADASIVTADAPLTAGETVVLYATGLSSLENRPPTGEAASAVPLSIIPVDEVDVLLIPVDGGFFDLEFAEVQFAGLSPGFVGLAQINIKIPDTVSFDGRVRVVLFVRNGISQDGFTVFTNQ